MSESYSTHDKWIRIFSIPETKLHEDGFTLYKISSIVFQRDHPESSTSVEVWRRYSSVHQLYKTITLMHVQLNLSGKPPVFSKPSLINRFDDDIIETRKISILKLLRYCGQHPQLFTSEAFTSFFQDVTTTKRRFSFLRKLSNSRLNSSPSKKTSTGTVTTVLQSQQQKVNKFEENEESVNVCSTDAATYTSISGEVLSATTIGADSQAELMGKEKTCQPSFSTPRVIDDEPKSESSLVKRTSGYFLKAEQLVARFLANKEAKIGERKRSVSTKTAPLHCDPYLKNYKVIDSIGKILVAIDNFNKEKVTIKILEVSLGEGSRRRERYTIPSPVPFMAPLIRFHETDCAIYLVVKYISGGRLWDHLKKYIKQPPPLHEKRPPTECSASRIYEGQRLILEETNKLSPENSTIENQALCSETHLTNKSPLIINYGFPLSECQSALIPKITPQGPIRMSSLSSLVPLPPVERPPTIDLSVSPDSSLPLSPRLRSLSLDALNDFPLVASDRLLRQEDDASEGSGTLSGISEDFDCSTEHLEQNSRVDALEDKMFDISSIIENSRKLLENVNLTLERSKQQVLRRVSSSHEEEDFSSSSHGTIERKSSFSPEEMSLLPDDPPLYSCEEGPMTLDSVLEKYTAAHTPSLPEGLIRVWMSQVVSAVEALHNQGLIWGDLNPSNLLLDEGGGILLTYFGDWILSVETKRHSLSRKESASYVAPELSSPLSSLTFAADWWSVGVLLFHLVTGEDVFSAHPCGINSHTKVEVPSHVSAEATSLIEKLVCSHPGERLGGSIAGAQEIKDHPFFFGIHWSS